MEANLYLPTRAWRTTVSNVIVLSQETIATPAIYRVDVFPIDVNELGAIGAIKEPGDYLKDFVGHTYKILAETQTTVDVEDSFRCGVGPQSGRQGIVYKSVGGGESPYLAPIYYRHLDKSAIDYSRQFELDIVWKTREKVFFTNTATPSISNYQEDFASHYGEYPDVTLITYDTAGVEWERQDKPIRNYIGGKLDNIIYDLMEPYNGYIILSR
jgi:hypothetical protein